jgi:S1-C subfamily serine protease
MPAGSRAVLTVTRGRGGDLVGSTREVTVTLGKKYVSETRPAFARNAPQPWRGMSVDYATALPMSQLHERAWDIDPAGCIAVVDVVPDSPAWKAGMRPWTFVSHVGSSRVETPQEFYAAVATANGGVRLRIAAGRGGEARAVSVSP